MIQKIGLGDKLLARKTVYRPRFFRGDYFVIQHINQFVCSQVQNLSKNAHRQLSLADIGCGEQPMRSFIEDLGLRYTGIDVSQNLAGSVDIIASLPVIPRPNDSFDCILCTEVLEHVYPYQLAIKEMARLLRNGGKLIVTVPFVFPLHETPHDFHRITPFALEQAARDSGLVVEVLEKAGNELEVIATILDNMRIGSSRRSLLFRVVGVINRVLWNWLAIVVGRTVGDMFHGKIYLTTMVVFSKMHTQEAPQITS